MSSVFREEHTYRVRADNLFQQIPGAEPIANEFWGEPAGQETIVYFAGNIIALSVISGLLFGLRFMGGAIAETSSVATGVLYVLYNLRSIVNAISIAGGNLSQIVSFVPPVIKRYLRPRAKVVIFRSHSCSHRRR